MITITRKRKLSSELEPVIKRAKNMQTMIVGQVSTHQVHRIAPKVGEKKIAIGSIMIAVG